jgi:acylphosphatase
MESDETRITRHVLISGRVQGVGFRAWVRRTADSFGVSGWVRNLRSGEVEAVFSGPETAVSAMIAACRQGPEWSSVQDVSVENAAEIHAGPLTIVADR